MKELQHPGTDVAEGFAIEIASDANARYYNFPTFQHLIVTILHIVMD